MPNNVLNYTPQGWPYMDPSNYVEIIPQYTDELAAKLENADADVAAAINAANVATTTAAEIQAAAAAIQAASDRLARLPYAIASGSFNAGAKSGSAYVHTITFPAGRFTAPPDVVVTIATGAGGTQALQVVVQNRTTTQAEIAFFLVSGSMSNHFCIASWVAVQA